MTTKEEEKETGNVTNYLVTIEIEAEARDPVLLEAVISNVVAEGLTFYEYAEPEQPFHRLRVLQSPAVELDEAAIRQRRMAEDRMKVRQQVRVTTFTLPEANAPAKQLTMPWV